MAVTQPITEQEAKYIRDHHKTMSVIDMARQLKRGQLTLYNYMDDNNLSVYQSRRRLRITRVKRDIYFNVDLINSEYTWIV